MKPVLSGAEGTRRNKTSCPSWGLPFLLGGVKEGYSGDLVFK